MFQLSSGLASSPVNSYPSTGYGPSYDTFIGDDEEVVNYKATSQQPQLASKYFGLATTKSQDIQV